MNYLKVRRNVGQVLQASCPHKYCRLSLYVAGTRRQFASVLFKKLDADAKMHLGCVVRILESAEFRPKIIKNRASLLY